MSSDLILISTSGKMEVKTLEGNSAYYKDDMYESSYDNDVVLKHVIEEKYKAYSSVIEIRKKNWNELE